MTPDGVTADRTSPKLWNSDWLVLRGLGRVVRDRCAGRLRQGDELVDVGCGRRPYEEMFRAHGIRYRGADIDEGAELLIAADGRVPMADAAADAVLSIQVLEHVRDLDSYLGECRRLLKPGGSLFLSTHGTWLYHPHPEDHRRWTRTGLVLDVERRGFKVEKVVSIVGPLATTTLVRLTGFSFALRSLPLIGKPLAGLVAIIMNLRAVIEDKVTPHGIRHDNGCVYWIEAVPA